MQPLYGLSHTLVSLVFHLRYVRFLWCLGVSFLCSDLPEIHHKTPFRVYIFIFSKTLRVRNSWFYLVVDLPQATLLTTKFLRMRRQALYGQNTRTMCVIKCQKCCNVFNCSWKSVMLKTEETSQGTLFQLRKYVLLCLIKCRHIATPNYECFSDVVYCSTFVIKIIGLVPREATWRVVAILIIHVLLNYFTYPLIIVQNGSYIFPGGVRGYANCCYNDKMSREIALINARCGLLISFAGFPRDHFSCNSII